MHLAAEVLPSVRGDVLGIHVITAVAWSRISGDNWTGYATAHHARSLHPRQDART
jgi:hypothetical protein